MARNSSLSEKPLGDKPRRLVYWLNPAGEKKVHSLVLSNTFFETAQSSLVKAGCGKTARPV